MVRIVSVEGSPVIDEKGNMSGRGAYVCRSESCLETVMTDRGRLSRAFKEETEAPDSDQFRNRLGLFKTDSNQS